MLHVKQGTPRALHFLDAALADAAERHLLRDRRAPEPAGGTSFCSNDYLGLGSRTAPQGVSGVGASRLVLERQEHLDLEAAVAELVGQPTALVFSSGYAANLGLMSCLAGPGDLVVSDALNHASIIDGIRLARCRTAIVPHLDADAVEAALKKRAGGRAIVVTESYFSMDADSPDLGRLRALCDQYDAALVVDEAHALGVLGPNGAGLCAAAGITPDALVGTFGKSFGASGAFVAGCRSLTTWLWNRARSFVFSTGISPALAVAALKGVQAATLEPERRARALAAADRLRKGLEALGVTPLGYGQIIPWVVGEPKDAVDLAASLCAEGLDVRAIRPPSVQPGTARLRLTVTADRTPADVDRFLASAARLAPWRRG